MRVLRTGLKLATLRPKIIVPGGGGAPEPGVGATILHQNDFDQATLTAQLAVYSDNGPSGFSRVAPGHGGSGASLQVNYTPATSFPIFGLGIPTTQDLYLRYWFRVTPPGWTPYSGATGSGFKWLMLKRNPAVGTRYTNGIGQLTGGPPGFTNTGWEFTVHDQSNVNGPNPVMSNINKSIRFETCNDGNWHKINYHVKTSAPAYEQVWVDDTLLLDTQIGKPGVPVGGYDHDSNGIEDVSFCADVVDGIPDSSWNGNVEIDDMVIWTP